MPAGCIRSAVRSVPSPVVYEVGDVIEYRTFMDRLRRARVIGREPSIEGSGHPGFDAIEVTTGEQVWGWDGQVERVIENG